VCNDVSPPSPSCLSYHNIIHRRLYLLSLVIVLLAPLLFSWLACCLLASLPASQPVPLMVSGVLPTRWHQDYSCWFRLLLRIRLLWGPHGLVDCYSLVTVAAECNPAKTSNGRQMRLPKSCCTLPPYPDATTALPYLIVVCCFLIWKEVLTKIVFCQHGANMSPIDILSQQCWLPWWHVFGQSRQHSGRHVSTAYNMSAQQTLVCHFYPFLTSKNPTFRAKANLLLYKAITMTLFGAQQRHRISDKFPNICNNKYCRTEWRRVNAPIHSKWMMVWIIPCRSRAITLLRHHVLPNSVPGFQTNFHDAWCMPMWDKNS
jgi:hypothetical protein